MTPPLRLLSYLLITTVLTSSCSENYHPRDEEHPEWSKIYTINGIDSAGFEVFDNSHDKVHYYNIHNVSTRRAPASTFKIFIALVALETGIAPDESLIIPWDGTAQDRKEWEHDLDLKQAMQVSSEPYFRELIRRIGRPTMQAFLDSNQYGNMRMGENIEDCWHDGSLLISPDEQVGFINHLYHGSLSFSQRTHRIARRLLLVEDSLQRTQGKGYKISYKTGLNRTENNYNAWYIGYLEDSVNNAHPYFFANNFDISLNTPIAEVIEKRRKTTLEIFQTMGLL